VGWDGEEGWTKAEAGSSAALQNDLQKEQKQIPHSTSLRAGSSGITSKKGKCNLVQFGEIKKDGEEP
jgi:hypothetical protein